MLNFKVALCAVAALLVLFPASLLATHNLGGHISYRMTGPMTATITLVTYADPSPAFVDRCVVDLEIWNGTGTTQVDILLDVERQNGPLGVDSLFPPVTCGGGEGMGEYMYGNVKRNIYETSYTFPGAGDYLIRFSDIARVSNVNNVLAASNQAFFVESFISVGNAMGPQNSVVLLNHLWNPGCAGDLWTFNPGAYDPDGDSLAFEFVTPQQYDPPAIPSPISISGFIFPDTFGFNGPLTMDAESGQMTWSLPVETGLYAIAVLISEYRNGVLIGQSRYDKIIRISACNNSAPAIAAIRDTTILPGDTLRFDFKAWDPDSPSDSLYFQLNNIGIGLNSAFNTSPPAVVALSPPSSLPAVSTDTIFGSIEWATTSSMGRTAPYQIDLFAHDNISFIAAAGMERLSAHHPILVYIQAPVGVEEASKEELEVLVYPNPTAGKLTIQLGSPMRAKYTVVNVQGQALTSGTFRGAFHELETEEWPAGIYQVLVQGEGKWKALKVVAGQ